MTKMNQYDVIIPVYNGEKTIIHTIRSIEHSGLSDFSILIIDDGSTDGTKEACLLAAKEYDNIHYFRYENQGVSAARNLGLKQSDAKYIIFFDADDSVDSGSFARVDQIIREYEPDMLIYGMCFDYYRNGRLFRTDRLVYEQETMLTQKELQEHFAELYRANVFTSSCNKVMRSDLLVQNHISYNESYFLMEDFLFSLDCMKVCEKIYLLNEAIYRYRQSEDEGNVYRRIKRIDSISDYMKDFKIRLADHPDVLSDVYYMLLRQKLWLSRRDVIRLIAKDHVRDRFPAFTPSDKSLDLELKTGQYAKIRCRNVMLQTKHKIANVIKVSRIYQWIRKNE